MQALIVALLDYSKANSSKLELNQISPTNIVNEIIRENSTAIREKKATIQVGDLPESIVADSIKLKQLLQKPLAGPDSKFFGDGLGILEDDAGRLVANCQGPIPKRISELIARGLMGRPG